MCSVVVKLFAIHRDQTTSTATVVSTFVCTGQASDSRRTLEEYVLLSALLHIFVGLRRTIDQKLSSVLMSGPLNVAIACLMFFQFRFADTEQYFLRPPWKNPCCPEVILQSSVSPVSSVCL